MSDEGILVVEPGGVSAEEAYKILVDRFGKEEVVEKAPRVWHVSLGTNDVFFLLGKKLSIRTVDEYNRHHK